MTLSRSKLDLTEGKLIPTIFGFAVPVILGALLQAVFNIVDQLVLGQMAGSVAVASVGATSSITHLLLNFFTGSSVGVTVLLAQMLGAKREENVRRLVSTALIFAGAGGAIVVLGLVPFVDTLLNYTNCPENCFDGARTYVLIYAAAVPLNLIYNYGAAILRTTGDSQRPMIYLTVSGVMNAGLNVLLCLAMENKVAAVGIATAFSYAVSAFLVLRRLATVNESYRLDLRRLCFDWKLFGQLLRYGLPNGLTAATYPLANLQIQGAINSFGHSATAGFSICTYVDTIESAVVTGFGGAAGAIMGHSIGAEKKKRVGQAFLVSYAFASGIEILLGITFYSFGTGIFSLFLPDDPLAVEYAMIRALYVALPYVVASSNSMLSHGINSFGKTLLTMISNLVSVVVFRILWMNFIYPLCPTLAVICQCFLVSWLLTMTFYAVVFTVLMIRYKKGKIKRLVN